MSLIMPRQIASSGNLSFTSGLHLTSIFIVDAPSGSYAPLGI
jgi:hypothetical protein